MARMRQRVALTEKHDRCYYSSGRMQRSPRDFSMLPLHLKVGDVSWIVSQDGEARRRHSRFNQLDEILFGPVNKRPIHHP